MITNRSIPLKVGDSFPSFSAVERAVSEHEIFYNTRYCKVDSRKIGLATSKILKRSFNPLLIYYQIRYACCKAPPKAPSKATGLRPNACSRKENCPASINFCADRSGHNLVITKINLEHIHAPEDPNEKFRKKRIQKKIKKENGFVIEEKYLLVNDEDNLGSRFVETDMSIESLRHYDEDNSGDDSNSQSNQDDKPVFRRIAGAFSQEHHQWHEQEQQENHLQAVSAARRSQFTSEGLAAIAESSVPQNSTPMFVPSNRGVKRAKYSTSTKAVIGSLFCHKCSFQASPPYSKSKLEEHLKQIHKIVMFSCPLCHFISYKIQDIIEHYIDHSLNSSVPKTVHRGHVISTEPVKRKRCTSLDKRKNCAKTSAYTILEREHFVKFEEVALNNITGQLHEEYETLEGVIPVSNEVELGAMEEVPLVAQLATDIGDVKFVVNSDNHITYDVTAHDAISEPSGISDHDAFAEANVITEHDVISDHSIITQHDIIEHDVIEHSVSEQDDTKDIELGDELSKENSDLPNTEFRNNYRNPSNIESLIDHNQNNECGSNSNNETNDIDDAMGNDDNQETLSVYIEDINARNDREDENNETGETNVYSDENSENLSNNSINDSDKDDTERLLASFPALVKRLDKIRYLAVRPFLSGSLHSEAMRKKAQNIVVKEIIEHLDHNQLLCSLSLASERRGYRALWDNLHHRYPNIMWGWGVHTDAGDAAAAAASLIDDDALVIANDLATTAASDRKRRANNPAVSVMNLVATMRRDGRKRHSTVISA